MRLFKNLLSITAALMMIVAFAVQPAIGQTSDDAIKAGGVVTAVDKDKDNGEALMTFKATLGVVDGQSLDMGVNQVLINVHVAEGWHFYPRAEQHVYLDAEIGDDGEPVAAPVENPTVIHVTAAEGIEALPVIWQEPNEIGVSWDDYQRLTYGHDVWFAAPFTLIEQIADGSYAFDIRFVYQRCKEACIESDVTLAIDVLVKDGKVVGIQEAQREAVTGQPEETVKIEEGWLFEKLRNQSTSGALELGFVQLLSILGLAVIGGALLNFTPCVLPVIPIKIMGLTQSGGSRKRTLFLGGVMFAGVVFFWMAVAAGITIAKLFFDVQGAGTSSLIGLWWFTLAIGLLVAVMSIGMLGLWTVQLPQWVYRINPKHDSIVGAFGFGIMTAVLALPCTGPFLGGVIGPALSSPVYISLLVFFALGAGMGAPYLLLLMFPKLIEKLPRVGPGSELLKQILGILMLAAGVYFIAQGVGTYISGEVAEATIDITTNYRRGLADGAAAIVDAISAYVWWPVWLITAWAGVWLLLKIRGATEKAGWRIGMSVFALVLIAASIRLIVALGIPHEGYGLAPVAEGEAAHVEWVLFRDEAQMEELLNEGNYLLVDFTANWCPNCKFLEKTRIATEEVQAAVRDTGIVMVQVDMDRSEQSWAFLNAVERASIPQLLILDPKGNVLYLEEWYGKEELVEQIRTLTQALATSNG